MMDYPGYQVVDKLYESNNSLVYRGRQSEDGEPVILKFLKKDHPTPEELLRYKQEYETVTSLNLKSVVKAHRLEKYHHSSFIIFEDIGAQSLDILMSKKRFTLYELLCIAIKIVKALGEIHAHGIIHKDINPSNIIFNPETNQLQIIDFGISTSLPRENPTIQSTEVIEGTLSYIAPEQTGRMNRAIDYRTDFYSLGATFYELLLHRTPFNGTDSMELIHCHMAKQPKPPHEVDQEIPPVVSDIIMKLLEKNAENRYQSVTGIKADLERCLSQFDVNGGILDFSIGYNDISDKFQIPQKLYGREDELNALKTAFDRVSEGNIEILLIIGPAGIGKTALIKELYMPVIQHKGYFIAGKFDQFKQNIPYSAIINAFQDLIRQFLIESEKKIEQWREKLLKAFGSNGQVIIDVIPEVELIIGKQPPVPKLPPAEARNRFELIFQNFITALTKQEYPLILFLDDLQWIDSASLKLIRIFLEASDSNRLLLIGAYRDNEVSETHPLMLTLDDFEKTGATVSRISLSPLALSHVNELVSDTLISDPKKVLPLTHLILTKTNGNPFFVGEFLRTLYEKEFIIFDRKDLQWKWSIDQIRAQNITDNVVEMIAGRIQNLGEDAKYVLKLAACIGNRFDINTLGIVSEKSPMETVICLREAVAESLVFPLGGTYKFLEFEIPELIEGQKIEYKFSHDRIQQAAHSLIPEEERCFVHLTIGHMLLTKLPPAQQEQNIFTIVNHLNSGIEPVGKQSEKDELARLNLIAGKKAKATMAYEQALRYLSTGVELLGTIPDFAATRESQMNSCWHRQYDLALDLYVETAEAAYLCTDFEKMEKLIHVVLDQAKDILDKVKVYEITIQACIANNKSLEGVHTGLAALRLMGVKFPEKPHKLQIILALLRTKFVLAGKQIEDLIELPKMNDPIKLATIRILMNLGTAAYQSAPELFPLIVLKGVRLSVKHGNSIESTIAYASYGIILCAMLDDIDAGYRFGQLSLGLLSRFNGGGLRARTTGMVNNFVKHWKEPIREILPSFIDALKSGLETGDFEWASFAAQDYYTNSFIVGKELGGLKSEFDKFQEPIDHFKQKIPLYLNQINHQAVLNFIDSPENPCQLVGDVYNEHEMLPQHMKANAGVNLFAVYFSKLMLCYIFQNFNEAIDNAAAAEKYIKSIIGQPQLPLFHFYDSLSRLAVFSEAKRSEQNRILKKIAANQKKMKKWAHHAPMNYLHKFYLVEAERNRVHAKFSAAADLYDKAISLAKENEYINEEALGNELAARFYLENKSRGNAERYMTDARYCYLRWGALAKVKDLDMRYPELLGKTSVKTKTETFTKPGESVVPDSEEEFDLISMMKITKTISSEIVLSRLLNKLMRIMIENAGAQKGALILNSQGKLLIEAEGSVDLEKIRLLDSIPVENATNLPHGIINYVFRTHEYVVLNNHPQENVFMNDAYILAHKPESVLCAPLLHKSQLIGILYIENSILPDIFSGRRLEIIKALVSQIAVSLENARLYKEMNAQADEIKAINDNLSREIDHRKKAEAQLDGYRRQLEERVERQNLELEQSRKAMADLRQNLKMRNRFRNIIGKSEKMQEIYALIKDLSDLSATVLITGESGTGKELVAEALHYEGNRKNKPFVKVNCSALSESILESELFGHTKGAFTGADKDKIGRFQKAGDGTIFLDEIGDITPYFQKRLLRVLQEREFEQMGDTTTKKMNARVLAATNQDLVEKVSRGEFRRDLYYRLRVVALNLPPLRDRREDIPILLRHFLKKFSSELGKEITDVSEEVLKKFIEYPWPGNIRELKNTLENICILCKTSTITLGDLPSDFMAPVIEEIPQKDADTPQAILRALEEARWNKTRAAGLLGMSRRTLYRKLKEYNMIEDI